MSQLDGEYCYTQLPNDCIRVLVLLPAPQLSEPIFCHMEITSPASTLYYALSYTWAMNESGDASKCAAITVDGASVPVTQNLFESLQRIRLTSNTLRIWIDAVCIDQDNPTERSAQVARMSEIYSNAHTVAVWLGNGASEEDDFAMMKLLQRLTTHGSNGLGPNDETCVFAAMFPDFRWHCKCTYEGATLTFWPSPHADPPIFDIIEEMINCVPPDLQHSWISDADSVLRTLNHFFARRYWSRRWIVQELFHANKCHWFWGAYSCRSEERKPPCIPESLGNIVRTVTIAVARAQQPCDEELAPPSRFIAEVGAFPVNAIFDKGIGPTGADGDRSNIIPTSGKLPLLQALRMFDDTECSDPRDLLFALSSMCEPNLAADYTLPMIDVYKQWARALITDYEKLPEILANLNQGDVQHWDDLRMQLPFWTPDFRLPFLCEADNDIVVRLSVREDDSIECDAMCWGVVYHLIEETSLSGDFTGSMSIRLVQHTGTGAESLSESEQNDHYVNKGATLFVNCDKEYLLDIREMDDDVPSPHTFLRSGDIVFSLVEQWHYQEMLLVLRTSTGKLNDTSYYVTGIIDRHKLRPHPLPEGFAIGDFVAAPSCTVRISLRILPCRPQPTSLVSDYIASLNASPTQSARSSDSLNTMSDFED